MRDLVLRDLQRTVRMLEDRPAGHVGVDLLGGDDVDRYGPPCRATLPARIASSVLQMMQSVNPRRPRSAGDCRNGGAGAQPLMISTIPGRGFIQADGARLQYRDGRPPLAT
jgi:hypothetical protein